MLLFLFTHVHLLHNGSYANVGQNGLGSYVCNIGYQRTSADKQADNNCCDVREIF